MSDNKDYEKFYKRVGKSIGWDFSEIRSMKEGVKWDFYDEVIKKVGEGRVGLDLATGGGKKVLKVSEYFKKLIGIDKTEAMIEKAEENLEKLGVKNVEFKVMDSMDLRFEDETFDVVTCRHGPFNAEEVYRVLKSGGVFMTQQVGLGDKRNIKQVFQRGQGYGKKEGSFKRRLINELKMAGFSQVESDEYEAVEFYERIEDVVFLLKHTPIIIDFGEKEEDFKLLEKFVEENMTEKGIRTTELRFMLSVRK